MRQIISILITAALLYSCDNSGQSKTAGEAKKVESAIKENRPGTIPTSAEGYAMTAKINGKNWTVTSMMPPEAAGRIIGYYDKEYIGLPYSKNNLTEGKKITFSDDEAVDLATNDDVGMWGGRKGEMEITKIDDKWVEGKFFFTGSTGNSAKTIEVIEGFFRIPVKQ